MPKKKNLVKKVPGKTSYAKAASAPIKKKKPASSRSAQQR